MFFFFGNVLLRDGELDLAEESGGGRSGIEEGWLRLGSPS